MEQPIPTGVVRAARPARLTPREVNRAFRGLLDGGARLLPAGTARSDPMRLLSDGYSPKHLIELFGTSFYLTNVRQNPLLRFFVGYVVPAPDRGGRRSIYPRIFYKDISLVWRCASHVAHDNGDLWIGKGDTATRRQGGWVHVETLEATTDLPLELQDAFDATMRAASRIPEDWDILERVLRAAPGHRIEPYRDFTEPRRRAFAVRANRIHDGKPIAWFRKTHVPESLTFAKGFEPDFRSGLIEKSSGRSSAYGGRVRRFRFLSRNRRVQYLFFAGPRHAWLAPPQALTTELSSYGVRTIDAIVDEHLVTPGYEYHFEGEDGHHSQIPPGFVGPTHPAEPDRADASAWLDRLPVIREFRRAVG